MVHIPSEAPNSFPASENRPPEGPAESTESGGGAFSSAPPSAPLSDPADISDIIGLSPEEKNRAGQEAPDPEHQWAGDAGTDLPRHEQRFPKSAVVNIAWRLRQMVRRHPHKRAVVYPAGWDDANGRVAYTHLTFIQLDKESDALARGLERYGIGRGVRTILMTPPSLEFFSLTFALFKVGAVPVIVDPGMGRHRMVQCLEESRAEAFIGISRAHLLRYLHPGSFRTVNRWVTIGRRWLWRGRTLNALIEDGGWEPYSPAETAPDEEAAILFTTGSTGPARGVRYTHAIFDAQVDRIQEMFQFGPDEIDLPTFPLFSLFDSALGMTAVIPDMNPTRPAEADPEKIIEAIFDQGVTNMFASPALLNRLGEYHSLTPSSLPTLRRVISAGAPVSPAGIEQFCGMLPDGAQVFTPYGATEAMPVLCIGSREILSDTRRFSEKGYGICVGRPAGDIQVRIIRITDDPIAAWTDQLVVDDGEIGEIAVSGAVVTPGYISRPREDELSKIPDGDRFWRRMGDLGWRDNKGRIWFCGRKSQRVMTAGGPLFTIPCESVFRRHSGVRRAALVGVGDAPGQRPVMVIERNARGKEMAPESLRKELMDMAVQNPMTEEIRVFLFNDRFPVDIRHNAKIFREQLRDWAEKQ
ncbi:MAG: peptide synthase [Desulfobacterales bacterium]|nr:MAG: peptide synthase [Desulfobacterales bacterium]